MPWFVYILFCDQKTFYIGIASDVQGRLKEHQRGYSPYTKKFSDIKLVYFEKYPKSKDAKKRERQLKGWSFAKKKALINGNKDLLMELSKSTRVGENGEDGE
jgi:putative endonuclease